MKGMTGKNYVLVRRAPDKTERSGIAVPESYRRNHAQWYGTALYQARVEVVRDGATETVTINPGATVYFESCRAEYEHPEHGEIAVVRTADVVFVEADAPTDNVESG